MPKSANKQYRSQDRVDERDVMFSRAERKRGTEIYGDFYSRRPELKEKDDRIRQLTPLRQPGGRFYDPRITPKASKYFDSIDDLMPDANAFQKWESISLTTKDLTVAIKRLATGLGAVAVGCCELSEKYIYTHKGRFDRDYGKIVNLLHYSAIVFLVEMDFDRLQHAPHAETLYESARQYYCAARIAKSMEAILINAGHSARAHYDAHYDIILPPLAVLSGLGEVGRNNILIADKYGSRVRIGAVTVDIPLNFDKPRSLGVQHFCSVCLKCAENCPSRALSKADKKRIRGIDKWPTNVERCYTLWRMYGTDCGICIVSCPFSHRNTLFHKIVRWVVRRFPMFHKTLFQMDNLFYGRNWKPLE
ncbi:MAG: 4Fe-4S dicluster domain-containing protein [Candidatus Neomarinimicrobiota bacterium]